MSDTQNENVEQPTGTSEIEARAMEMGWRPKEEFSGNEEDFIDAKEFVRRKPLFDKIEHQGKQIKLVTRALDSLKQHYTKVEEVAVQKALAQLKEARKDALANGDGERFEAVDEQIKYTEQQLRQIEQTKNTPVVEDNEPHPDFVSFKNRNKWYQSDAELTSFADRLGVGLAAAGMSADEVLKEIEQQVKTRFPSKFRNPNKDNAPDTENSRGASKSTKEDFVLSDMERKVMNDLVRTGVTTKEKYIQELKDYEKSKGIRR